MAPDAVTLNPWRPSLIRGGPAICSLDTLRRRDLVLADLTKLDERELLVTFVPRDAGCAWARRALLTWAATVGYRRIWLDDAVVDLDNVPANIARAAVSCPTCGLGWEDQGPDFWGAVRDNGWFPGSCPACGGSLPEWIAADTRATRDSSAGNQAPGSQDATGRDERAGTDPDELSTIC